jgi:hypothetical protein
MHHTFTDGGQFGLGGELAISTDKPKRPNWFYNTWLPINGMFMERDRLGRLHCVFSNQSKKKYLLNRKTLKFQE